MVGQSRRKEGGEGVLDVWIRRVLNFPGLKWTRMVACWSLEWFQDATGKILSGSSLYIWQTVRERFPTLVLPNLPIHPLAFRYSENECCTGLPEGNQPEPIGSVPGEQAAVPRAHGSVNGQVKGPDGVMSKCTTSSSSFPSSNRSTTISRSSPLVLPAVAVRSCKPPNDGKLADPEIATRSTSANTAAQNEGDSKSAVFKLIHSAIIRREAASLEEISLSLKPSSRPEVSEAFTLADAEGFTLLHVAVRAQNERAFRATLDLARRVCTDISKIVSDPGQTPQQYGPLHMSAQYGNVAAAKELLRLGARCNVQSKLGATPLHLAAARGNVELCRLLIEHGADINAATTSGSTPLSCAKHQQRHSVVSLLIAAGVGTGAN